MSDTWMSLLSEFLVTYWIHSSIFVGIALIAIRKGKIAEDTLGECLLKIALVLGIISSLMQVSGVKSTRILTIDWSTRVESQNHLIANVSIDRLPVELAATTVVSTPTVTSLEKSTQGSSIGDTKNTIKPVDSLGTEQHYFNWVKNKLSWEQIATLLFAAISYLWIFFCMLLLAGKIRQVFKLRLLLKRRKAVIDKRLNNIFSSLIMENGLKSTIKLSQSSNVVSPITLNTNEIVLPEGISKQFQYEQIRAALAHELAHIKRKDCLWLWIGIVVETLFFFQPLNRLLTNNINRLAEHRSDKLAAEWTGDPQALAEALAVVARSAFQSNQFTMVATMTSDSSNLVQRIENLLQQYGGQTKRLSLGVAIFVTMSMLILAPGVSVNSVHAEGSNTVIAKPVKAKKAITIDRTKKVNGIAKDEKMPVIAKVPKPVAPAKAKKEEAIAKSEQVSTAAIDKKANESVNFHQINEKFEIKANLNGKLKFNENETAIISFPNNSRLEIIAKDKSFKPRLVIAKSDGVMNYSYYEDELKKEYGEKEKNWLFSIIPDILRSTGIDAEARVARIRSSKGDEGVLDEIELINSDFAHGLYLRLLFKQSRLSAENLIRVVDGMINIESDFEQARVLRELIVTQEFDQPELWIKVFNSTQNISSDFELASFLIKAGKRIGNSNAVFNVYLNASSSISSDFEMRKTFSSLLDSNLQQQHLVAMLSVAGNEIGSDFELASFLIEAGKKIGNSNAVFNAYLNTANSISSDFEMRRTFSSLLDSNLQQQHLVRMLGTAGSEIGSDFELANLLVAVIDKYTIDSTIKTALIESSNGISSSVERNRVNEHLNKKVN